jgi:hypothetical protein
MTGEEFGKTLLESIEAKALENNKRDIVALSLLASVVRRALGLPDQEANQSPVEIPQRKVRPEFPHLRVKYDPLTKLEVARKVVNSLDELGQLLRSDPLFYSVLPIDAPLPSQNQEKN